MGGRLAPHTSSPKHLLTVCGHIPARRSAPAIIMHAAPNDDPMDTSLSLNEVKLRMH